MVIKTDAFEEIDTGISSEAVRRLQSRLTGVVIEPGDSAYSQARLTQNAVFDHYPAVIVQAATAEDVARTIDFAGDNALPLAVKSGGHSIAGHSSTDAGVIIDLSQMRGIEIDPEARTARVGSGLTSGELTAAAQAQDLAVSTGDTASVGLGGLMLGGGIGWMVRSQGLTIDNLRSVDVVTANGRFLTASAEKNADLFWALRGGCGNFGVATSFEVGLHPVGMVYAGAILLPVTGGVVRGLMQYALEAPEELTMIIDIMGAPPIPGMPDDLLGKPVAIVLFCYTGAPDAGERAIAPVRSLAAPLYEMVAPMPYPAIFNFTEASTHRAAVHVRSAFMRSLSNETVNAIVEYAHRPVSLFNIIQLRGLGGAMARVPSDATAFAHRQEPLFVTAISEWADPMEDATPHIGWTEGLWNAIKSGASGVYANFLGNEGLERIRQAYPERTYTRLAAIKAQYDPSNMFRLNQNIRPRA